MASASGLGGLSPDRGATEEGGMTSILWPCRGGPGYNGADKATQGAMTANRKPPSVDWGCNPPARSGIASNRGSTAGECVPEPCTTARQATKAGGIDSPASQAGPKTDRDGTKSKGTREPAV